MEDLIYLHEVFYLIYFQKGPLFFLQLVFVFGSRFLLPFLGLVAVDRFEDVVCSC